jgi:signal transduction histidine kinase
MGVTVLTAMLLGFSLQQLVRSALPYLGLERQQTVQRTIARFLAQLPGNIATLTDVLDAAPNTARAAIIAAAQRPHLQIHLLDTPLPRSSLHDGENEPDARLLKFRIMVLLRSPHPIIVSDRYMSVPGRPGSGNERVQNGTVVESPLSDGRWVLFIIGLDPPAPIDPVAANFNRKTTITWLCLSVLLGTLLSFLATRRLVTPLCELALAVEKIGGSGDSAPIALRGPREVQGTILAFNRMQERLRRFNEDRTRMLAAMSHDLRTPLTRLRLRSELVENADQQQKMQADISFMSELIESILSFARDDTKREPRGLVDLSALIEGICENASDAGESVTFTGPRGVTISCRPAALRRAISNLVENAIKYGKTASVTLACTMERAIITVEDEGPGIPRAERERVFDPFYRMETSRNLDTGGVGLGLSVTRSIILEHGGEISLADRKGGGLLVRVELPGLSEFKTSDRASEGSNGVPREQEVGVDNT